RSFRGWSGVRISPLAFSVFSISNFRLPKHSALSVGRWTFGVQRFWSASAMNRGNVFERVFALGNSYWLTRFVILRLLGFVYAVAFLVAAQQLVPLIGEHGLTPANHFLSSIQAQLGSQAAGMLRLPTLFWFGISDNALS